jgi:hypothetical protein
MGNTIVRLPMNTVVRGLDLLDTVDLLQVHLVGPRRRSLFYPSLSTLCQVKCPACLVKCS